MGLNEALTILEGVEGVGVARFSERMSCAMPSSRASLPPIVGIRQIMSGITLLVEDPNWRIHRGLQARLKQAAEAARRGDPAERRLLHPAGRRQGPAPPQSRFSRQEQGDQCPVLSGSDGYAGDIAIAHGVTKAEAKTAGKKFADHATHLVVHGVLHLAGYDHERPRDAQGDGAAGSEDSEAAGHRRSL